MNSIMVPKSVIEPDYAAEKYFKERFPDEYSNMSDNPNYADSGCGIAIKATETEQTLVIKDPANEANDLCTLKFDTGKLKFTYSKGKMVDNIVNIGTGSTEKLEILGNNVDSLEISVVKTFGGNYAMDSNIDWYSVCYGNGKVVAVARNSNTFAYSYDGITWTEGTISETNRDWKSVCYGKDKFVAVTNNSNIFAYSTDGIAWTEIAVGETNREWQSVCYGNNKYVTIAYDSNTFAYSTDGIAWTEITVGETNREWQSVCYGNGKFVAISGAITSANTFAYSYDGITWYDGNLDDTTYRYNEDSRHIGPWNSVCYGKDKFVVCGYCNNYCYSYDGINWTMYGDICSNAIQGVNQSGLVCYGNNKFVAIGMDECESFSYSIDGINWKMYKLNNKYDMTSICYFPNIDQFIAVGEEIIIMINLPSDFDRGVSSTLSVKYEYIDAPTILPIPYEKAYSNDAHDNAYSAIDTRFNNMTIYDPTDMTKWTECTISDNDRKWYSICYGKDKYVAVAYSSNIFAYSLDGITWTEGTISKTNSSWYSVCYGKDKFVAVAYSSNIFAYSLDGITWTEGTISDNDGNWKSVCYGNDKFVIIDINSNTFAYSYDDINWTEGTISSTYRNWASVCYGKDKFVAIAISSNIFAYSTDGITWTEITVGETDRNWYSVCYGKDKYVAVASSNIFAYSYDGINWTEGIISKTNRTWYSVCYGNNKYVTIAYSSNTFAYSYDGINWTEGIISKTNRTWYSVCYGKDKFVAVSTTVRYLNAPSDYYQFSGWNKSNDETVEYLAKNGAFTVIDAPIMNYGLSSVCYGNDTFVALSGDTDNDHIGYIVYSTDGINWSTTKISYTNRKWYQVCYCNDKFIAISYGDKFAYSTDGITWTEVTVQSQNWEYVYYGNGRYVAIASWTNIFAYSTDGITWTVSTISATSRGWSALCYGNDRFVAATWGSNVFAYSTDGITWTEVTSTITDYCLWRRAIYNKKFIVISYNNDKYAYSYDGTEWHIDTILKGKNRWHSICYTGYTSMIDHPATIAISTTGYIAYSTDNCETWTQVEGYYSGFSIACSKDRIVIVHPMKFCYSIDDQWYRKKKIFLATQDTVISGTWTKKNSMEWYKTNKGIIPYALWRNICYGKDKFVAVANNSNTVFYSYDGIEWHESNPINNTSTNWYSICYGNGKFIMISMHNNAFAYSYNGIKWTEGTISNNDRDWYSVCYGKDKFVAIVYYSNVFAYSTDGITWTEVTVGETNRDWQSVCYGNNKFIAIAENSNTFAYSYDGITWTEGTISETNREWRSVCYGNDKFVAIARYSNVFAYSLDGITWTEITVGETDRHWISVCYGKNKYVAVTNNSNIFAYSTDGITWTDDIIDDNNWAWGSICYGNGKFVVICSYTDFFVYSSLGEIPSEYRNIYGAIETIPAYVEPEISPIPGLDTFTVGSTFKFGKYQVESEAPWAIEWEIVHQTDEYQIAQTKQIIDLRCFDAKEPNNTNTNRKNYGNNNWRYSNIQQWLNSDKESWYSAQHTYDQAPNSANVWQSSGVGYNPYDTHKGFLYYFTDEEKALLKDMTLTLANNIVTDGGGSYTWTGKVWLPTYTQMSGGANNNISEGTKFDKYSDNNSRNKTINKYCAENNAYCKANSYTAGKVHYYWMSSASPSNSYNTRYVGSDGSTSSNDNTYIGDYGLAPCICLPRKS